MVIIISSLYLYLFVVTRNTEYIQWAKYHSGNAVMVFDSIAVYQNPATTIEAVTSRTRRSLSG